MALTACALVVAVPTLSSCGFNYATDEVYTASAGTDIRTSRVDVLNAVIVSDQDNVGSFVATFSNNETKTGDRVTAIGGDVQATGFTGIRLAKGGFWSMAAKGPATVTGTFKAGDFVKVTIDFARAESVTFNVPVVRADGAYEGLAPSAPVQAQPTQ